MVSVAQGSSVNATQELSAWAIQRAARLVPLLPVSLLLKIAELALTNWYRKDKVAKSHTCSS